MLSNRVVFSLTLILCCFPRAAWSQTPLARPVSSEVPPYRIYGTVLPTTISGADAERQASCTYAPMIPDPDSYPTPPATAPAPAWRLITDIRLDVTGVPGRTDSDVDMTDIELASTWNFNLALAPLKVTPYAAAHYWNIGDAKPFLSLYDLNVEFAWRPRLAEWLFVDLAVTPGLYTDFKNVTSQSFQMRGRALAIVAFSEKLQLAGGAMYVNRIKTKVLPAGGVIWNPSDDTRCFLVFPQPKITHRFCTVGGTEIWGYVAGEFGGGRWEVEALRGENQALDYTDLRVILGVETVHANRVRWHVELGYVFNRRVNYANASSDFPMPSTAMARAGFRY